MQKINSAFPLWDANSKQRAFILRRLIIQGWTWRYRTLKCPFRRMNNFAILISWCWCWRRRKRMGFNIMCALRTLIKFSRSPTNMLHVYWSEINILLLLLNSSWDQKNVLLIILFRSTYINSHAIIMMFKSVNTVIIFSQLSTYSQHDVFQNRGYLPKIEGNFPLIR